MSLTAPARAARFALLQRFLVVLGLVAVAALLLFAATSKAHAGSPDASWRVTASRTSSHC